MSTLLATLYLPNNLKPLASCAAATSLRVLRATGRLVAQQQIFYDNRTRNLPMKIILLIAVLVGRVSAASASDLPACPTDDGVRWHNCFGTYT